jgi:hypothetical protein
MKEYFRKPYMTQGITKHSDYMKAIPQRAIDVQGTIAPNIEFKKPYDYHPNTAQMIHYYANNLHYLGGDPVPPLNDPSLLPHAPVVGVPEITYKNKLISLQPIVGADDGEWSPNWPVFVSTGSSTRLGNYHATLKYIMNSYVRFQLVNILPGSIVDAAFLTVKSYTSASGDIVTAKIYANKITDAISPVSVATAEALALTTNYTDWSIGAWAANTLYDTPDISKLIQEVIDMGGWKSGNSILMLLKDNGSATNNYKFLMAYETAPSVSIKLTVQYREPQ